MAIRPQSLSSSLHWLPHRKHPSWAVLLTLALVIGSMGSARAKDEAPSDAFEQLTSRGPHAVLELNPAGKVVPKPQADPEQARVAELLASTLDSGRNNGHLEVTDELEVTLTDAGVEFVEDHVAELTRGCAEATSVAADWTGYHVEVAQTCTEEELEARFGVEIPDSAEAAQALEAERAGDGGDGRGGGSNPGRGGGGDGAGPEGAGEPSVAAMGFAPPAPPSTQPDAWLHSENFGCFASIFAAVGFLLLAAATIATLGPAGWVVLTLTFTGLFATWVGLLFAVAANCRNLLQVKADKRVWVGSEPLTLPIAGIGFGSVRVGDDEGPRHDGYYTYPRVTCYRSAYWDYRYSYVARQYVPTGSTWRC